MCPALIKMYDHLTADTQDTTDTEDVRMFLAWQCFIFYQNFSGRGFCWFVSVCGFCCYFFWGGQCLLIGHEKHCHVEPGLVSFWMCIRKHLKSQGCRDNNWERCVSFSNLVVFLWSRFCEILYKYWLFFSSISYFCSWLLHSYKTKRFWGGFPKGLSL